MKLVVGSGNPGKIIEIGHALEGLNVDIVSAGQLGIHGEPVEDGGSYAENARIKAEFYGRLSNLPTMADDSGIIVEALGDELGVDTRYWGEGAEATDEQWIAAFLKRMEHETNRRARFVCTIAYRTPEGDLSFFEGHCDGEIARSVEAQYLPRLPISGCFRPDGCEKVYSALSPAEKNIVSHRGKALHLLRAHLASILSSS